MKRAMFFSMVLYIAAFMAASVKPSLASDVLLVDDYLETDEAGDPLEYQERRRFYQRWGVYNFDYDVWVIADQGMPDLSTLQEYQAVLFASDGDVGESDETWWYEVGSVGGGVLRDYMEEDGRLLAIGQMILQWIYNSNPPMPGDFEYDWFGVGSEGWDYWNDFTWAIGSELGYPDSMMLDVAKLPDQEDYAENIFSVRPGADTLFLKGLNVDGSPPYDYLEPVGIVYRPDGVAVTSLISFSLYFMHDAEAHWVMNNILRDEFGCTFYNDPAPLPPWHLAVVSIVGGDLYLSWDSIDEYDVVTIRIYRSADGGSYELYATTDGDAIDYTDQDVSPGLVYAYRLTCVDAGGQEGDFSHEVSEIGGRPSAPIGLIAESGDGEVTLIWNRPGEPGIVSFGIYKRSGPFGDFDQIAIIPEDDTSYLDIDVVNRSGYNYYVTSISEYDAESYPSETVSAFPHIPGRLGILIVNGIDWETYGSQVINLYQNHSFTGYFPYKFWDLFDSMPIEDFPDPEDVLGWGDFPRVFFDAFETIIWVGNNYNGDMVYWEDNLEYIVDFLESGGNLVLPPRYGSSFFNEELTEFAGIDPESWVTGMGGFYLIATHPALTYIGSSTSQSLCEFPMISETYTMRLWKPSLEEYDEYAAGFMAEPPGMGKFVYIAGRPYRWDNDDLRRNMEVILGDFFGMTGVDESETILPSDFSLFQNYPNPFNAITTIKYDLPSACNVSINIYDLLGRRVETLVQGEQPAGYHQITWDASGHSTGMYFYRIQAGEYSDTRKMVLLK